MKKTNNQATTEPNCNDISYICTKHILNNMFNEIADSFNDVYNLMSEYEETSDKQFDIPKTAVKDVVVQIYECIKILGTM